MLAPRPPLQRSDIVAAARRYLGVRWVHQGRTRHGLDCLGLVVTVARDLGLPVQDITDYGRLPDTARLRSELMRQLVRQDGLAMRGGDVLWMRFESNPIHVALATDEHTIIHAYAQRRAVVEHRLDAEWRSRVNMVLSFPGVA
jgi:cell wall-associated NlpC family hydrolase